MGKAETYNNHQLFFLNVHVHGIQAKHGGRRNGTVFILQNFITGHFVAKMSGQETTETSSSPLEWSESVPVFDSSIGALQTREDSEPLAVIPKQALRPVCSGFFVVVLFFLLPFLSFPPLIFPRPFSYSSYSKPQFSVICLFIA